MKQRFDAIIIGSGFGGSVAACRLAQAGAKVLVLERGRRWSGPILPRKPGDAWIYRADQPARKNGWLDLRFDKRIAVALGAGVGGGSLCYSSVLLEPPPSCFERGWPAEIDFDGLRPSYEAAKTMLGVNSIPLGQQTRRSKILEEASKKLGYEQRFQHLPLGVAFDPAWNDQLPDPLDPRHSKSFTNPQGRKQGTCIHLGNCDIGCDVRAKNTLDLNYLAVAENHGAEIRPLHIVKRIEMISNGAGTSYQVHYHRIENGQLIPGEESASKVIISAGSLGSTELLLRCRDEFRTLPNISSRLGQQWSVNANMLTPDIYPAESDVRQSIGPTITAGLDFGDGSFRNQSFVIQDDGFPNLLLNTVQGLIRDCRGLAPVFAWLLAAHLRRGVNEKNPLKNVLVWLGAGLDAADGRLRLGRSWLNPFRTKLRMDWNPRRSRDVLDAILDVQKQISLTGGGSLQIPWFWRFWQSMITVHPLGGCGMGQDSTQGVVDHKGEVFGYPGLHVIDGAMVPRPIGRNPSLTIAALAERALGFLV